MSGVRQSWLVAVREMRERSRSRAFLVSVAVMLISVAGAIVLPGLLDTGPGTKDVGLTGEVPTELPVALRAQGDAVDTAMRIHRYDTLPRGEDAVREGSIDVLVVDARRLEWRKRVDDQVEAIATSAIQLVSVRDRAAEVGIRPDDLATVMAPVPVESVELGRVAGRSPDDETAAFIMTLILFGTISTYGAMVLSGVVEEKSSRTVEVLLARMPARNLLAGKIVGIGLLGLAQIAATAAVAVIAAAFVDSVDTPAVGGGVVAWAVVWFLLGYALYATVFGTLGSLASRTEDASSVTGPVTIVLVLGFMASFAVIGSAETTWARVVSWFPLTAPTAMPNRVAMGAATWWDPVVAAALTLGTIIGLVVIGGRVYTRAILHTGAALTLRDVWRGTPVARGATRVQPVAEAHVQGSREATTERPDGGRPHLAPAAVGVLVGLGVFALSRDVIIGVAVGAALYTLVERARRTCGASSRSRRHTLVRGR